MYSVIGIEFSNSNRIYYFDPNGIEVSKGDKIIVETERGMQLGIVRKEKEEILNAKNLKKELIVLPEKAEEILSQENLVKVISRKYANAKNFIYIARGINFPTALEGALKLKEISYINATGYTAGELKHGPIAMLDETMPVLSILMKGSVYEKLL